VANVYASVCPSGLDRTPVAAMSGKFLRRWVDSDDEDSDESVSPPWRLEAACEWASFAHRLLLRQELRDKHYMMRMRPSLTFCRRLDAFICVTQFRPGHGKGRIDQTFTCGRLLVTRWHYGRLLRALAKGEHPLSTMDRVEFYLNGPPY
jgi:hypothetical protein